jgi:hypothetical protein|tara:strand:+ start:3819 stop:4217 length:399 start_codon:yes stop_codon:yes gene_type:complete
MLLYSLPEVILNIIYSYVSNEKKILLNKNYYKKYHYLLCHNYNNYIKNIISNNYLFIFTCLLDENYKQWIKLSKKIYKNVVYPHYISYILDLTFQMNNPMIRTFIIEYYKDKGLSKNLHKKKNNNNNNRWIQ